MPSGIFTLKQQELAIGQGAWQNPSFQSTFGARFNGTGSGQYLTGPTTSALNFGTGNFTVEFWLYISAYGTANLTVAFSASNGGSDFQLSVNAGSQYVYWHNSGIQIGANSASSFTPGRWTHIALVRSGTTVGLFCDGTRYGTATNSASINLTNFNIGSYWNSVTSYMVNGWVSNLRITNTAVYDPTASSLTLPLGPLTAISGTQLLTLQNATIVDNSANALTITNNGSVPMQVVYPFGGLAPYKTLAVDYLVVAGGGGGAGDAGGGGGAGGLLQGNIAVATGSAITVTVGAGGTGGTAARPSVVGNGGNSVFGSISATGGGGGAGYHVINAASGGSGGGGGSTDTFGPMLGGQGVFGQGNVGGTGLPNPGSVYSAAGGGGAGTRGLFATGTSGNGINGNGGAGVASDISGTRTTYAGGGGGGGQASGTIGIGVGGAGGGGTGGYYITGAGSGVAPTAGTANTGGGGGGTWLYNGGGGVGTGASGGSGIVIVSYPDTYAPAVATTGAPVASTSGSGSILFNGSTQYLNYSANSFSTSGNWTIEAWCYFTSSGSNDVVANGINPERLGVIFVGTTLYVGDGVTNNIAVSNAKLLNQWFHVAAVKNGSTYTAYINGSSVGSSTTALISANLTTWEVGARVSVGFYTTGYISNLRITTSAIYTTNFTPSTAPLTAVTNTQLLLNTVSGAFTADSSDNKFSPTATASSIFPTWNQLSPFATGLGYKNRVYTWTSSGSITF